MPNIYDFAEQFRAALLARDQSSSRQLIQAYGLAFTRLQVQLAQLTNKIQSARAAGDEITPAWLQREERFKALMQQVGAEINRLAVSADDLITRAQQGEVERALRDSGNLLSAAATDAGVATTFNRVNRGAVESLVGTLGDGSPLKGLLKQLPDDGRQQIEKALIEGVTLGENPRKVATRMREALGGNLTRALRIARTEQVRAYREASRATYRANSDVVSGWEWVASKSQRTCLNCLSRDGQFYELEKPLPAHPQCRCTSIPRLKGKEPIKRTLGKDWFDAQSDNVQREMMGVKAHELFKAGKLGLKDFEGSKTSADWGETTYQRSLKEIFGGDNAPRSRKPAGLSAAEARAKVIEIGAAGESEVNALRREFDEAAKNEQLAAVAPDRTHLGVEYNKWRINRVDLYRRQQEAQETLNKKLHVVLHQESPAKFKVKNRKLEPSWAKGIESFRRLIGNGLLDDKVINFKKIKGRANYDLRGNVKVTAFDDASVIVHELGHWLEDESRGIFNAVSEFMERRTKGEKIVGMNKFGRGYRFDEVTKPDEFMSPYMGKQYFKRNGERYASEIVSMGLEYMHSRPLEFARRDPDYFDFIYDLVRKRG